MTTQTKTQTHTYVVHFDTKANLLSVHKKLHALGYAVELGRWTRSLVIESPKGADAIVDLIVDKYPSRTRVLDHATAMRGGGILHGGALNGHTASAQIALYFARPENSRDYNCVSIRISDDANRCWGDVTALIEDRESYVWR